LNQADRKFQIVRLNQADRKFQIVRLNQADRKGRPYISHFCISRESFSNMVGMLQAIRLFQTVRLAQPTTNHQESALHFGRIVLQYGWHGGGCKVFFVLRNIDRHLF
jgi:hypothetical protein